MVKKVLESGNAFEGKMDRIIIKTPRYVIVLIGIKYLLSCTMKPKKKFIKNVQIGYYCLSQMQKIMEATWLLNAERMQTSMI